MATMDELAQKIHAWARSKGFYEREFIHCEECDLCDPVANPSLPSEKLCLVHSEVSEVLEALRDEDREHEEEECADIIIRVLDYAAWRGFSMDEAVPQKMAKNEGRPYKHGRNF